MFDGPLILLSVLLVLGILGCALVLPIVALVRTRRIGELTARVQRLEQELRGQGRAATQEARPAAEPLPRAAAAAPVEAPLDAVLIETRSPLLPAQPPAPPSGPARPAGAGFETWIGRQVLGWVAVVLALLAAGFFIQLAFDNQWIGEMGQVALGVAAGTALCLIGYHYHRRGWRVLSQMATAAGVAILYLAIFATFGFYDLMPRQQAGVFLVLLVAEAAGLALLYEAPAIELMAIVGALLAPVLLHTYHDQYRSLFVYLLAVNAGVVGLALFRPWPILANVALVGTQLLFWGWYDGNYHPEKMTAALGFQAGLFALHLVYSLAVPARARRASNLEDLLRLPLAAAFFAAAGYVLLDPSIWHVWMGTLTLGVAILYAALGWLIFWRRADDQRLLLGMVAVSMGFTAAAFAVQADAAWIALGWAVEGLALWWFGLRIGSGALRGMGMGLLLLAAGHLVTADSHGRDALFIPLFNAYALPASLVAACVLGAAACAQPFRRRWQEADHVAVWGAGLIGAGLVWLIITRETYDYFEVQRRYEAADLSLSAAWALYAAIMLAAGFGWRSLPIRLLALGLFAVTLLKVLAVDMSGLPGLYRVTALLVLALVLAGAARAYQKRRVLGRAAASLNSETQHDGL